MLWEAIKLAMQSVMRNKLRSVLTLLGIVIGVGAVIAMVTIGSGASEKVQSDLAKLGSNMLIVRPGQNTFGPPTGGDARAFQERDVTILRANLSGVRAMAPAANKGVNIVFGAVNLDTTITGTDVGFFDAQDWTFAAGRPFSDGEVRSGASVCVIGETIRSTLFGALEPVGQRIRVGKDRKSTRLNSSHIQKSRMPSSA